MPLLDGVRRSTGPLTCARLPISGTSFGEAKDRGHRLGERGSVPLGRLHIGRVEPYGEQMLGRPDGDRILRLD